MYLYVERIRDFFGLCAIQIYFLLTYLLTYYHAVWSSIGCILSSVRPSICLFKRICDDDDLFIVSVRCMCLNKWILSALLGTRFLQLSTPGADAISSNSQPPNLEILHIYYIPLSCSHDHFVYVAMNREEYGYLIQSLTSDPTSLTIY